MAYLYQNSFRVFWGQTLLARWALAQKGLANYEGIEAVVMNNHDLPRLISNWLNDDLYRVESAKLAITLFGLMKGNLYLYQGEEIGMTNAYMADIGDYNDVETLNKYEELKALGLGEKVIMEMIQKTSRDNARVPMQWSSEVHAGFTKGTPWLKENRNYKEVNVEKDLASEDSIYAYYKAIIAFRKAHYNYLQVPITFKVEGDVLSFERGDLKFVANFSEFVIPMDKALEPIFTNYEVENVDNLRPYEVYVTLKK